MQQLGEGHSKTSENERGHSLPEMSETGMPRLSLSVDAAEHRFLSWLLKLALSEDGTEVGDGSNPIV